MTEPRHLFEERELEAKKFKVGPIESDSGNHLIDIVSVFIGLFVILYFKKIFKGVINE